MKTTISINDVVLKIDSNVLMKYSTMTGEKLGTIYLSKALENSFHSITGLKIKEGLKKYTKEEIEDIIEKTLADELSFVQGANWNAVHVSERK